MFSFGLLFSLKPLCGSGKSFGAPSNQLTSIPQLVQCVYMRASLGFDSTSREKLGELAKMSSDTKNSFSLNWFQRMGLIWCFVMSPEHENTWSVLERVTHCVDEVCMGVFKCTSTCTYASVCVCVCGILPIFYWFIEPHESFPALDEIVCFFHYKQDQSMLEQPWLLWLFTDLGPDFTSLTSGCELWRCAYVTASLLLAEGIKAEWKKNCRISYYLCFSAAQPEKWKGSEL